MVPTSGIRRTLNAINKERKFKNKLFILWTNDNVLTSGKMVCMYAHNAILNNWWKTVTVIIWGATAKLVAENEIIQTRLKEMLHDGVKVSACKACADQLGVTDKIEALGIEVKYWGEPLSQILKSNETLLSI